MRWMKGLIDHATTAKGDAFTDNLATGEFTTGQGNTGFTQADKSESKDWGEKEGWDGTDGKDDNGDWYFDETTQQWTNGKGDAKTGEKTVETDKTDEDKGDWYQNDSGEWV